MSSKKMFLYCHVHSNMSTLLVPKLADGYVIIGMIIPWSTFCKDEMLAREMR